MKQSELLKNFSKLTESQKDRIRREIIDYVNMNNDLDDSHRPDTCPICNEQSFIIKKGKQAGKQRYLCKLCGHKFTYDTQTVTSCLKISREQFVEICLDTLECHSLMYTAARLNVHTSTVFNNRHRFLTLLEEILDTSDIELSGTVEADETYILESTKGSTPTNRKARHRGAPSKFRGISHEQVCIVTTTDRNSHEIFKAVGFGKPTTNIITETLKDSIEKKSIFYVDGATCYEGLASILESKIIHLKGHGSYNKVEHLNTVNNIHSKIKALIANYRGIATKYMNRYTSLFVFMRMFQDMDRNEMADFIINKIRNTKFKITTKQIKDHNLFSSIDLGPTCAN